MAMPSESFGRCFNFTSLFPLLVEEVCPLLSAQVMLVIYLDSSRLIWVFIPLENCIRVLTDLNLIGSLWPVISGDQSSRKQARSKPTLLIVCFWILSLLITFLKGKKLRSHSDRRVHKLRNLINNRITDTYAMRCCVSHSVTILQLRSGARAPRQPCKLALERNTAYSDAYAFAG